MNTEYVNCDLCGFDNTELWGQKHNLNIVKCKECGLVYTNPRFTTSELEKYYSSEYFSINNYAYDPLRMRMYRIEIETQIIKTIGTKGRFLDVGCAFGVFLSLLPGSFEKYGIEFSKVAAEYGRKQFGLRINVGSLGQCEYPDNFFDIIHLRGVIEHLQYPTDDLKRAYKFLKPGGYLIISTTPNIDSPAAKFYREMFKLVFPREHIYYFSPKTLSILFDKTGFVIQKVFYPYINTPYGNLFKDINNFIFNKIRNRESPPFFRSAMTFYARKI